MPGSSFVEAVLAAPAGVALLAMLEGETCRDVRQWQVPTDTDPGAVAAAADAVAGRSFGSLLSVAVGAAAIRVGPWISDAPDALAAAYRHAEPRASIAQAIDDRFGVDLHATVAVDAQQWWHSGGPDDIFLRPRFTDYDEVYGAGQFTLAGVWTVSDPPGGVHADLISAWELELGPVSRCHLPARPGAGVFEVHRPQDWARLVQALPAIGRTYPGWELPGPNQHAAAIFGVVIGYMIRPMFGVTSSPSAVSTGPARTRSSRVTSSGTSADPSIWRRVLPGTFSSFGFARRGSSWAVAPSGGEGAAGSSDGEVRPDADREDLE